jgi:nicotinamidase-related amidase
MPLTTLDTNAALIVIDLQKGIVGLPTVHPAGEIIGRVAQLARAFRERSLPVGLVHVTGAAPGRTEAGIRNFPRPADWAELVSELDQDPSDYIVAKQRWGAFIGTSLDDYLRQRSVTQVFITGISTSAGVESTARSAYDLGYNVVLVVDAMTDRDPESHSRSIEKIFPRLGETETTANVLERLRRS